MRKKLTLPSFDINQSRSSVRLFFLVPLFFLLLNSCSSLLKPNLEQALVRDKARKL